MLYPLLKEIETHREMIDVFGGYNHNLRISEGEFYDMKNLSSSDYPVLAPRPQRGVYADPISATSKVSGMISKDSLCYVDGKDFIIGKDEPIPISDISTDLEMFPKFLVSMGAYVIIMPDKIWVNTQSKEHGSIDAEYSHPKGKPVSAEICIHKGEQFEVLRVDQVIRSQTTPNTYTDGIYWLDISNSPVLKQYSQANAQWTTVINTYIKLTFEGEESTDLKTKFSVGDGVVLSGLSLQNAATDAEGITDKYCLNGTNAIEEVNATYIIVKGIIPGSAFVWASSEEDPIKIERKMPNVDFIITSGNRLWGCRYGEDINGQMVNEIYASKLGDFKNWNYFAGISTDSYAASVGTDGSFTGAINHLGYPVFFKENGMYRVFGNYPSNYQIQYTECRGVQNGCAKSLAIVNEILYYKSRNGVCLFDGSLPVEISSVFGDKLYGDATAGALGNKYYISMKDKDLDEYSLFVYDTQKGMWHREDDTRATEFCNHSGNLYYINYATRQIKTVRPIPKDEGLTEAKPIEWEAITGIIGTDSPDKKYISRLILRLMIPVDSTLLISAEYDSSGAWEMLYSATGKSLTSVSIPIRPKRCDHLRLKLQGKGAIKVFSICKVTEKGSDL